MSDNKSNNNNNNQKAFYITAGELAELGIKQLPSEMVSKEHLIYSSPAALSFNSPGAQGFGVKRAGLAIPGSVMLLVAPACCGRNTTMLAELGAYADRFYYLLQDDTDIITGRHLNRISKAVKEVADFHEESSGTRPSAVMICITCVDALLGTDMERVCKKASEYAGLPVLPCYMYALEREGRVPPMTAVRRTVYRLLEPRNKKSTTVNLLGHFAPLEDDTELYDILRNIGIRKVNEISRCESFEEYLAMAEANFNIILNSESRLAAEDIAKRLEIPSIELKRMYRITMIHKQYQLFAGALGVKLDDSMYFEEAEQRVKEFSERHAGKSLAIGECLNADSFELALAMTEYGLKVKEIYAEVSDERMAYVRKLAKLSPDTRVYTNLEPTMLYYDSSEAECDFTVGMDAGYYHPDSPNIPWNLEIQPWGYKGLIHLLDKIEGALLI